MVHRACLGPQAPSSGGLGWVRWATYLLPTGLLGAFLGMFRGDTVDNLDLKEWMQDKFESQNCQLKDIKDDLSTLNRQVTSHDRWLWLLKGMGTMIILLLGFIGIKVKVL